MPKIYANMADLDLSADAVEDLPVDASPFKYQHLIHSLGTQLEVVSLTLHCLTLTHTQIPKCIKGISLRNALDLGQGAMQLAAETKYDSERMQIHVFDRDNVKIFS